MARLTRRGREIEAAKGNVQSPLKYLPTPSKPKKPRGNATAASQSIHQAAVAQQLHVETTSASSQSPQPTESRSSSPPAAESRSTSPPAQQTRPYSTRAASASRSLSVEPERAAAAAQSKKVAKKPQQPRGKKAASVEIPSTSASTKKVTNSKPRAKVSASRARSKTTLGRQSAERSTSQSLQLPGSFPTHDGDISLPSIEGTDNHISTSNSRRPKRSREASSTNRGADSTDEENTGRSVKRRRNNARTSLSEEQSQHNDSNQETRNSQHSATRSRQSTYTPRSHAFEETPSQAGQFFNDSSINFDDSNAAFSTPKDFSRSRPKLSQPNLSEVEEETAIQEQLISENNVDEQSSAVVYSTPVSKPLRQANFTAPPRASSLADDFKRSDLTPRLGVTRTLTKPKAHVNNLFYDPKYRRESYNIEYDSDDEGVKNPKGYTHQELHEKNNKMKALNRQYRMMGAAEIFPLVQVPSRAVQPAVEAVNKKTERGLSPVHSRPSTSISESSLVIPASSSGDRMILTDPKIIDAARSVALWASSNPTSSLPDSEQMTALLEYHQSKDLEKVSVSALTRSDAAAALPAPVDLPNDHVSENATTNNLVSPTSHAQDITMSGGIGDQSDEVTDDASEVEEVAEPVTPSQQKAEPEPKPSGWFSSFGALVKTPINLLRGRQQVAGSSPTNARAETEFTSRHTSTFSPQPTTPTQSKSFKRTKAQSEQKRRRPLQPRTPQEPIRVDRFKDKSLPIEQRGLISEKRIKEIQAEQDAKAKMAQLLKDDRHASERQKLRIKYQASIEEVGDDDHNYGQATTAVAAAIGEKRKHKDLAKTPKSEKQGYSVPSSSESDSDDDERGDEFQVKTPSNRHRTAFDLSTIDEVSETSSHLLPQTKGVFQQPPLVQANINRGASPISLKNRHNLESELDTGSSNLFGRASPNKTIQKKRPKRPLAPRPTTQGFGYDINDPYYFSSDEFTSDEDESDESPAPPPTQLLRGKNDGSAVDDNSTNESLRGPRNGSPGTFTRSPIKSNRGMNDGFAVDNTSINKSLQGPNDSAAGSPTKSVRGKNDGSSVDNILIDETLQGPNGAIVDDSTTSPAAQEANSVLQQKQWQQTPPPKAPRPSNAELPQALPPSAADIAMAKVNKHQPKQPSGLRYVKNMSPLQLEQQRLSMVLKENYASGGSLEAIEAVENLKDEYVTQIYLEADDRDTTMKDYSDLVEACDTVDNLTTGFS